MEVIEVPRPADQARAVMGELERLRDLGVTDLSSIAVLARQHDALARVRALAERMEIPVKWWADRHKMAPLHQVREISQFLRQLERQRASLARASQLLERFQGSSSSPASPETECYRSKGKPNPWREFIFEACAEGRREFSYGEGVTLGTVHSAKGTEYDHVLLVGPWPVRSERKGQEEEERRTFYVGMTRARKTLAIFDVLGVQPTLVRELEGPSIYRRQVGPVSASAGPAEVDYTLLGLEDVNLGYPGLFEQDHLLHRAVSRLEPGDPVTLRREETGVALFDLKGRKLIRLSRRAEAEWQERLPAVREVRVVAVIRRSAEQDEDSERRSRYQVAEWEVPLVEVVWENTSRGECPRA